MARLGRGQPNRPIVVHGGSPISAEAQPGVVVTTTTTPAPTVTVHATIGPAAVPTVVNVPNPSVTTGSVTQVDLTPVATTTTIPAPTIGLSQNLEPDAVATTTAVQTPSISAQKHATVFLGTVATRAGLPVPAVTVPILPGDLITGDYQIEFGGLLFGAGAYQILSGSVEGWDDLPELDPGNALRPSRHGAWPGRDLGQERTVSALVAVNDNETFVPTMRALRRATRVPVDGTESSLVIRTREEVLLAYGKIMGRVMPPEAYSQGIAVAALRWTCSDPRRYDLQLQSRSIEAGSSATLSNDGDTAASPVIKIYGPVTTPQITNTTLGRTLAFAITLDSGERLDVDCANGTVKIGVADHTEALSALSVPVEEWLIDAGDNVVTYATGSGGAMGIEIQYRHSYL